jgi:putative tryptophan/tyrosine transport system substrate-binding protein
MRRREFIAVLGGAAVARPVAARAQQASVPKVGWLSFVSPESSPALPFFKQGLADVGYVEGHNLSIEYASARSHPELFPALAANLVQANVAVIAAVSGAPAARAAKAATDTIPIVFITPGDPVKQGSHLYQRGVQVDELLRHVAHRVEGDLPRPSSPCP